MTIPHISKKDLVISIKCFLFQPHGAAPSHILFLRHRDKGDGWFNPVYPCRQEIMFPFPVVQQVPSWIIICLAFLKPQLPVMLVHGFPIPVLTCPSGGKLPHHPFPSLSHVAKQRIIPSLTLWLPQFFLEDFSKVFPVPLMGLSSWSEP